jgi:hypothetical protein
MPQISLPERGQPVDLSLLRTIVNAINELYKEISPSVSKFIRITVPGKKDEDRRLSDTKMLATYKEITNSASINAGNEEKFTIQISGFKEPPIVTATPRNVGATTAGGNVSVVLNSVTATSIEGTVRFNAAGTATVGINLIAVGIPS